MARKKKPTKKPGLWEALAKLIKCLEEYVETEPESETGERLELELELGGERAKWGSTV